jgi:hypothetical protein
MTASRLAALALFVSFAACKTTTIYNVEHTPLNARTTATSSEVADVIREAGRRQGWVIQDVGPGEMRGMLSRRRHTAVVAIHYDSSTFSIEYVDSTNLKHEGDEIHKAYNVWVKGLEEAIKREAAFRLP